MKLKFLIEPEISGSIKFSQIETGKFVAYLVEEELKSRKKKESYSGTLIRLHTTSVMRAGLDIKVSLIAHLQVLWATQWKS